MSGVYLPLEMSEEAHDFNGMRQGRLTRARAELDTGW
jgi:hypothetical protein